MEAIGVDVGGTKIAAMRIDGAGNILARDERPALADDPSGALEAIADAVSAVDPRGAMGIGLGVAGLIASADGVVRFSPNNAWREMAIGPFVGERFGLPWNMDNDATAAAYGEYRFGAGTGKRHILFVIVGTGIGGGIVVDGAPFRGANGFAGEIGHVIVEPGGEPCGCGNLGCLETVASGTAIGRMGREAAAADPHSALAREGADAIDARRVVELARGGDGASIDILAEAGRRLGEGIGGYVNILDPEVVIVGGGAAAGAGELLLGPARAACRATIVAPDHRPEVPILAASLGNDAGAIGAASVFLPA